MKKQNDRVDPIDDLIEDSEDFYFGNDGKTKKDGAKKIVRIEELQKRIDNGEDISADEILSTYMPHRKARLFAASLRRLDKLRLGVLIALGVIVLLFLLSFMQENMGNFTINLDRLELYRKGLAISADRDFTEVTARLVADSIEDATNITWTDIPENVDEVDGCHNGRNYMAYTYYVRNAGKEDVAYDAVVTLDNCSKGAETAVRVAVWSQGECTMYAAPASDGGKEDGCENFESDEIVCTIREDEFKVGYVNKYTIVVYMEGEDPECVDEIVGGSVQFSMKIDAVDDDDSSLFEKLIGDISDTITGDNPIGAAGEESPDFVGSDVTWETRLNK